MAKSKSRTQPLIEPRTFIPYTTFEMVEYIKLQKDYCEKRYLANMEHLARPDDGYHYTADYVKRAYGESVEYWHMNRLLKKLEGREGDAIKKQIKLHIEEIEHELLNYPPSSNSTCPMHNACEGMRLDKLQWVRKDLLNLLKEKE